MPFRLKDRVVCGYVESYIIILFDLFLHYIHNFFFKNSSFVTQVTVVRARDKLESVLRHYLIEDRSGNGASSYVEFLIYLHKEIRALLS